jgi:hypothetical protein
LPETGSKVLVAVFPAAIPAQRTRLFALWEVMSGHACVCGCFDFGPLDVEADSHEDSVPNDRSPISIISFVECVLVELTHEPVAAEYVSSHIWGEKRTHFFAVDDSGERFQKRYSDDRLGKHNTLLSRRRVRTALINRLSRETVGTKQGPEESVDETDTFRVRPLRELER